MLNDFIDVSSIARQLGKARREGKEWKCLCPAHDDHDPSLSLSWDNKTQKILVKCWAGCDPISILKELRNRGLLEDVPLNQKSENLSLTPTKVSEALEQEELMDVRHQSHSPQEKWEPIFPVPKEAPKLSSSKTYKDFIDLFKGRASQHYPYLDEQGRLLGYILRWDAVRQKDGGIKKEIRPFLYCKNPNGNMDWRCQGFPSPRPLYNLHKLTQFRDAPVLIGEGEKVVHAAETLLSAFVTTTSMGGACAAKETDFSPLKGRNVILALDEGEKGLKYGKDVHDLCKAAGVHSIKVLNNSIFAQHSVLDGQVIQSSRKLPQEYDLADALQEGWTPELLSGFEKNTDIPLFIEYAQVLGEKPDEKWEDPLPINESTLLPVESFDINKLLPLPLRVFVRDCSYRTQVPPDLIAAPLVAMFSALLGARYRMCPKQRDSWEEVPNLWSMIIAPPGSLKTNCLSEALKPMKYLAATARKKFEEEHKEYEKKFKTYEMHRKILEKKLKNSSEIQLDSDYSEDPGLEKKIKNYEKQLSELEMPKEPFEKRYMTSDSTIEMLQELLKSNVGGLLVERDELISLLMSFEMSGHEADRGFYLQGWNGNGSYHVDRIGRGSTFVPHLCLSLVGTTQPEKIQAYIVKNTSALANDGLIQRFQLMVYPDPLRDRRYVDQYPDHAAKNVVYDIAKIIAGSDFLKDYKEINKSAGASILSFHFEKTAQPKFEEWFIALEKKIDEEEEPILKEHQSKYRGLIPSLALIFHVIQMAANKETHSPVSEEALQMAIAWHSYLESHARRIYGMGLNVRERAVSILAKKLLEGEFKDGFAIRDVTRKNFSCIQRDTELTKEICEELEEKNWLRSTQTIPEKRHKIKTSYDINPKITKFLNTGRREVDLVDIVKNQPTMSTLSTPYQGPFEKNNIFTDADQAIYEYGTVE